MAESQGEDQRRQRGGYQRAQDPSDYEPPQKAPNRDNVDWRSRREHGDEERGDSRSRNRQNDERKRGRDFNNRGERQHSSHSDRDEHRQWRGARNNSHQGDRRHSRGDRRDFRERRGRDREDRGGRVDHRNRGDRRHSRDDWGPRKDFHGNQRGDKRFDRRDGERRDEPRKPIKNPDLSAGPIRRGESRRAPDMPKDMEFDYNDLDKETKAQLRTLNKQLAELVGKRILVTAALLEKDPQAALEHALYARSKASRVAAVRDVAGVAAYYNQDWKLALAELKASQRLTGTHDHVAMIADCERALGRPERAIDLYRDHSNDKKIPLATRVELLIVASGARRDMGMGEAATVMLQVKLLNSQAKEEWVARLRFAYAEALLADGRENEGRRWLHKAVDADTIGDIGASERLLELDGVDLRADEIEDETELACEADPDSEAVSEISETPPSKILNDDSSESRPAAPKISDENRGATLCLRENRNLRQVPSRFRSLTTLHCWTSMA